MGCSDLTATASRVVSVTNYNWMGMNFMHIKQFRIAGVLLSISSFVWIAGCQTTPSMVEANFGSSVRNQIALQTAAPNSEVHGMDGTKASVVLGTYRADVAKPEKVERDLIQIKLGK